LRVSRKPFSLHIRNVCILTCVVLPQQLPTRTSRPTWYLCRAPASTPRFCCRGYSGWSSPPIQLPVEPSLRVGHSLTHTHPHTSGVYRRIVEYKADILPLASARAGTLDGTCQYLLAGADCVANRILQVKDLECEKKKKE
jgi:hypothetical protein